MDDEDSKVRRNLVVACTVVLLAWWLGIPFDKVSDRFLGFAPTAKTFEWRVWFAAAVALLYFAWRFRFSDDHKEAVKAYAKDRQDRSVAMLTWWARREIAMFVRVGDRMPMPLMGSAFKTIAHAAVKGIQRAYGDENMPAKLTRAFVGDAAFQNVSVNNGEYGVPQYRSGIVRVQFFIRTARGEDPSRDGAQALGVELAPLGRAIAWLGTQVCVLVYSNSGTRLLLPWAMALAAGGLACLKIIRTW